MKRLIVLLVWTASALMGFSAPAFAHPHIFVDAKATIVFDDAGRVKGIRHEWAFDEAFSAWSVQGLDTNNDGTTSQDEMQELADEDMTGLAEYEYYTFAGEGPDNLTFTNGRGQTLNYVDGHTVLRFEVDLDQPYAIGQALEIAINDPEYYVAITFANAAAVTLENAPKGCAVGMEPGHDMPPELADQLYALPPDVTQLPADLENALRGVQGAILVKCPSLGAAPAPGASAANAPDAAEQLAEAAPLEQIAPIGDKPFGGPPPEPSLFPQPTTGFFGWVAGLQREFYQAITNALASLKTNRSAFFVLGGLSFLYGIFHAAGPGHGKVVISSYVLANERQVVRGVVLSFAAAMVQSLVAVLFVLVAAWALNLSSLAMSDAANWIGIASYGLVALLGVWLIARHLFGHRHDNRRATEVHDLAALAHAHLHDPRPENPLAAAFERVTAPPLRYAAADAYGRAADDPHFGHDHGPDDHRHAHEHLHAVPADRLRGGWREQLGVVLAVGLRPCSGALVVLVFALSQGLLAEGIAAVFLMGLGTAITVTILATIAVTAKGLALRMAGPDSRVAARFVWWAELLGAVLVLGFGLILLIASL